MERTTQHSTDTHNVQTSGGETSPGGPESAQDGAASLSPEAQAAQEKLKKAEERFLSAAIAFCDGLISEGQLHAVREMLREQELRAGELLGDQPSPFVEDEGPATPPADQQVDPLPEPDERSETSDERDRELPAEDAASEELQSKLAQLDEKIARLEADFQQGRINASQYRAIRRHYMEQHDVAMRLHKANPTSDRWRVVLEEGKTSFLMQLNEAECRCIAFYDIASQDCIYREGELPDEADDAMRFLGTFGPPPTERHSDRMFATQTDEGLNLLLIPGRYTAALVAFSDEPPGWQVRALREVVHNFEAANKAVLERGQRDSLVFPNLDRFFRD